MLEADGKPMTVKTALPRLERHRKRRHESAGADTTHIV
jgi:hypothetical protein